MHAKYADYLVAFNNKSKGRPDLDNVPWLRANHHIIQMFDNGSDTPENKVLLSQYEHGLIHLFQVY